MDIEPLNSSCPDPYDVLGGHDIQWLAQQYPLTTHGADVRASCSPAGFQLRRSTLTKGDYAFVIVDKDGQPVGGDSTVACFSNCGKYAFPTPPDKGCDDSDKNSNCYRWKAFCLGDPSKYGPKLKCKTDSDCPVAGACWDLKNPSSDLNLTCEGRGFIKDNINGSCNSLDAGVTQANCPNLTYPYGYVDPFFPSNAPFWSTQPPYGLCSDVSSNADGCIGDDTLHNVMPKAYTWPNDPQVYGGDATAYRVIFAPGGNPTPAPITPTNNTLPACSTLNGVPAPTPNDSPYDYPGNLAGCGVPIDYGALFAVAHTGSFSEPKNRWACDLDPTGAGNEGVICTWPQPATAVIQQVGLRANYNSAGSSLQLSVIPGVQNNDLLIASITFSVGAGTSTPPAGWTQVPGASVANNNNQTVVWYHFVTNSEPSSYTWTWTSTAYPSGGLTAWRGVNTATPFDAATAATALSNGPSNQATAPSISTPTLGDRLLSVYGAGGALQQTFAIPIGHNVGGDETFAVKVIGGPTVGSYYAHFVGDRIQTANPSLAQTVEVIAPPIKGVPQAPGDWTAISIALKPLNPYVPPAAVASGSAD
jgi:hypothetical protein